MASPESTGALRASRVLVVTSWAFDDALIQTYTLPYLRMIVDRLGSDGRVLLVTQEPSGSRWGGGAVPVAGRGIEVLPQPWAPVGSGGARRLVSLVLRVVWLAVRHRVDVVHAFATPAGLPALIAALVARRPLVVDSFEPHAEAMVENGTWSPTSMAFKVLSRFERLQARRAWAVVATTSGMREYSRDRLGAVPERFFVKPACVDLDLFHPPAAPVSDEVVRCVYAGKLGGIYLERELFELFSSAVELWGERFRVEMITDAERATVEDFCRGAGVDPAIVASRRVPHAEVAPLMRAADFAVNPVKPVPTKRYCTSIKDGEYWATGLPVLITMDISDDSEIIAARRIGAVITSLTAEGYRAALTEIDALLRAPERERVRRDARATAEELRSVALAERVYDEIYGAVTRGPR